jgi:hypothetical protein
MSTFAYLYDYVKNGLKIASVTEDEVSNAILQSCIKLTGTISDLTPTDTNNQLFYTNLLLIKDDTFIIYKSTDMETLLEPSNSLSKESFDVNDKPFPAFSEQVQVDYVSGALRFETPLDFDTDFIFYQCLAVDQDKFEETILKRAALTDRVSEEERSNVRIKRRSYLEILADKSKLSPVSAAPLIEIEVGTFSRLSNGIVYGIDEFTGEVIP